MSVYNTLGKERSGLLTRVTDESPKRSDETEKVLSFLSSTFGVNLRGGDTVRVLFSDTYVLD